MVDFYTIAIESIPLMIIILLQLYNFIQTKNKITLYQNMLSVNFTTISTIYLEDKKKPTEYILEYFNKEQDIKQPNLFFIHINKYQNKSLEELINALNMLIFKHRNEIKDINPLSVMIDDYMESINHEINLMVQRPLYLGLLGTIIGIFIGLVVFAYNSNLDNTDFLKGFLINVSFAMLTSGLGLSLTFINSAFFHKEAQVSVDRDRKKLDLYLIEELIPKYTELSSNETSNLRNNLMKFNREFGKSLNEFKGIFGNELSQSINSQKEVINKLAELKISEILDKQINLFQVIESNSNAVNQLGTYFDNINSYIKMSLDFQDQGKLYLNKIDKFENVFHNFEEIMNRSSKFLIFVDNYVGQIEKFNLESGLIRNQIKDDLEELFELNKIKLDDINSNIINITSIYKSSLVDFQDNLMKTNQEFLIKVSTLNSELYQSLKESNKLQKINDISKNSKDILTFLSNNNKIEQLSQNINNLLSEQINKIESQVINMINIINYINIDVKNIFDYIKNESNFSKFNNLDALPRIENQLNEIKLLIQNKNIDETLFKSIYNNQIKTNELLEKISKNISNNKIIAQESINNNIKYTQVIPISILFVLLIGFQFYTVNKIPDNSQLLIQEIELLKEINHNQKESLNPIKKENLVQPQKVNSVPIPIKVESTEKTPVP